MDLKQIEYIVKIAETGNITRAAEQLFVTQSALNQQLLKLGMPWASSCFTAESTTLRQRMQERSI